MKNVLWGLAIVLVGVALGLNALEITNFDLLFDGWWTLFIIVPCVIGLFTESDKVGNLIGIGVGVALLAACQEWIVWEMLWKLLVPAVVILVGLRLIFKDLFNKKAIEGFEKVQAESGKLSEYASVFSGQTLDYSGKVFEGVAMESIFGGIKCDLRNAVIEKDAAIRVTCIFGGADILVPENVNVEMASTCIFGGLDNKRKKVANPDAPTLYVTGTCIFGGADIK